jgi:hypothetical protein
MLLSQFRESTIEKVETFVVTSLIESLIKEDLLLKIITPAEILSGEFFNYQLAFKVLMNMPEEQFVELINKIKNSPEKFIKNEWGFNKEINCSIAFNGPNAEELGRTLRNAINWRSKDKGDRRYYDKYMESD